MHPRNKYKHGIDYIALAEHVAPQIDINRLFVGLYTLRASSISTDGDLAFTEKM